MSEVRPGEHRLTVAVPVSIECPDAMLSAVRYVLDGEYESHHDGTDLDILDIGANVGSFALWATRRWPGSRLRCFEPNPETFAILNRNLAGYGQLQAFNAAIYPSDKAREAFFSRYAGDGEAGLLRYIGDTFRAGVIEPSFEVDIIRPEALGSADIVKIDEAVLDEECPWDPILDYLDYRRALMGDIYGRMFYRRRGQTRLVHRPAAP